jgi:hypothetical protein
VKKYRFPETSGGSELASEKNCASSGDYICDTYADPNLFYQVAESCRYIGIIRDESGKNFVPPVANIMSDSPAECRCVLMPLQYCRHIFIFINSGFPSTTNNSSE